MYVFDENGRLTAKRCSKCGTYKPVKCYSKGKDTVYGIKSECKACKVRNSTYTPDPETLREQRRRDRQSDAWKLKKKLHKTRRRTLDMGLCSTLTPVEWRYILDQFDGTCALGISNSTCLEHFIPTGIGHGGTYVGNVYPLDILANSYKRDLNPFEWIKTRPDVDPDRWNRLVEILAAQNGLTVDEFRAFVYWCFDNPRTIDEIKADGDASSLELWRQATSNSSNTAA